MRAFGYEATDSRPDQNNDETGPVTLKEVCLNCKPDQLQVLAQFLLNAADLIEKHGNDFGHEHLRDWWEDWQEGFVDVIVVQERMESLDHEKRNEQ